MPLTPHTINVSVRIKPGFQRSASVSVSTKTLKLCLVNLHYTKAQTYIYYLFSLEKWMIQSTSCSESFLWINHKQLGNLLAHSTSQVTEGDQLTYCTVHHSLLRCKITRSWVHVSLPWWLCGLTHSPVHAVHEGLGFNSQSYRKNCVTWLSVHALRLISRAGKRVQRFPL